MAEKKMTRAQALEFAMNIMREHENESDIVADLKDEALEVLGKMHASVTRPRKKSDAPSKTQRENAALAEKVFEVMTAKGEPVESKWICEHVNGIATPQKCTAVMKVLIDSGEVTKSKEGKRVTYSVVE